LEVPWLIPAVILIREWGITIMRFALKKYEVLPAGRGGKLKTVFQSVAIAMLLMPLDYLPGWVKTVAWTVLAIALALTILTGIDYALDGWALRQKARAAIIG
jgi:CDP-diacylglycerol--glycerol-3-phosphate 3-phosphatidyltransferase